MPPSHKCSFVSCVCCVGSGLCDKPITRSEESYRVCMCVCASECVYHHVQHSKILVLPTEYEGWNLNSGNYLFTTDTK